MLSISNAIHVVAQAMNYYMSLTVTSYYAVKGEVGMWFGVGADRLGLSGAVTKDAFRNLLNGFSPDGGTKLVQNAGRKDRIAGHDLTFNAPKTVSVAWSQGSDEVRRGIEDDHIEAGRAAMRAVEQLAGYTRTGKGGKGLEAANLIFGQFTHYTSRAEDPHLHTHFFLFNIGVRTDGRSSAVWTPPIFDFKMAAGAIYQAELAARLRKRFGWVIKATKDGFELAHVPPSLIQEFSKRRAQITSALERHGASGAVAAKIATLDTRPDKTHRPLSELLKEWQEVGRTHGYNTPMLCPNPGLSDSLQTAQSLVRKNAEELAQDLGGFTRNELIRSSCHEAIRTGAGTAYLLPAAKIELKRRDVIPSGYVKDQRLYTLRDIQNWHREIERDVKNAVTSIVEDYPTQVAARSSIPRCEQQEIRRAILRVEQISSASLVPTRALSNASTSPPLTTHEEARKGKPGLFGLEVCYTRLLPRRTKNPHIAILVPRLRVRFTNPILIYDTRKLTRLLKELLVGKWPRVRSSLLYEKWGAKLLLVPQTPSPKRQTLAGLLVNHLRRTQGQEHHEHKHERPRL